MRIITGTLRGRKLKSPKTYDVRPTSDKVKEAVFDMLQPYMTDGFICMDVFAGSGNLGLEAISRGAKTVYFSDNSRESLALVRENVKICGAENNSVLLSGDFKSNIARVHDKVDIFFIDPPYADRMTLPAINAIDACGNLKSGGVIVCEHSAKDVLPDEYLDYVAIKQRKYGAISVTIYQKKSSGQL